MTVVHVSVIPVTNHVHTFFRDQYLEAIEVLPLANTPEVFGLHANAEINYFTRTTKDLWIQLVELQPQTTDTGTGISREEFISGIASDIQVLYANTLYYSKDIMTSYISSLLLLFV